MSRSRDRHGAVALELPGVPGAVAADGEQGSSAGEPSAPCPGRGLRIAGAGLEVAGRWLFRGLDLDVRPGQVAVLMGPSGSGKSSLLAWLCGTLPPVFRVEGRAWLDEVELGPLAAHRRRIGILFQDDLLFPHLSVGGNLAFGLPARYRGGALRRRLVDEALERAELGGLADRDPATLSGGQRSRVAVMRMLLAEPRALLLDEPFARLDRPLRARFRSFVLGEAARLGLPVLLATHDADDAAGTEASVVVLGEAD